MKNDVANIYTIERGKGASSYKVYFTTTEREQAWAVYKRLPVDVGQKKRMVLNGKRTLARDIPRKYSER